jgi:hypothetical protein
MLLVFQSLIQSCASSSSESGSENDSVLNLSTYSSTAPDTIGNLTQEQQTAFDALNAIQVQGKNLYSTFPGISHSCPSKGTDLVLTRNELSIALNELLKRHYNHITPSERASLVTQIILIQDEYNVVPCSCVMNTLSNGFPDSGTWILPQVLGRRDIVIEW